MEPIKFVVIGSVDFGKCYQKGTKIRTFENKIKLVEELKVGESVISVNGDSKKIIEYSRASKKRPTSSMVLPGEIFKRLFSSVKNKSII